MKAKQFIGLALVCAATMTAAIFTACDPEEKEKPTYTVTFDADGGTPAPAAQKVIGGEKATAPAAVTKAGYSFLHWSKDGTAAYDFATPVTADFTLKALWRQDVDNARLIGRWEAAQNSSGIVSVEFGVSGNYIVAALPGTAVTRAEEYDAEDLTVYFGTYTIGGDVVALSDLGTVTVKSLDAAAIYFTLDGGGEIGAIDLVGAKAPEMPASTRTDLLCRTWKFVDLETNDPYGDGPDDGFEHVYFSKAGTYLVTYLDGTKQLANWKWKSEASGELYYSWDFPADWAEDGLVTVETLTEDSLVITEDYVEDGAGVYYYKSTLEPASAPATRSGHPYAAPIRAGTPGRGFFGR